MAVVRAAPRRVLLLAWLVSLYSVLAAGDDPAASLLSQVRFKQWHCLSAQCRSLEAALEHQHAPSHTQLPDTHLLGPRRLGRTPALPTPRHCKPASSWAHSRKGRRYPRCSTSITGHPRTILTATSVVNTELL